DGMKENVRYYLDQNAAGIVIVGSTGEFASMDEAAKKQIAALVGPMAKGTESQLIVGVPDERTSKVIEYASHAEANHTAAQLVIHSVYQTPTEEESFHQFKHVNDQVRAPIMMYNNPFTANVNLENETIFKIDQELDKVQYIKESSGDILKVRAIADHSGL